MVIDHRSKCSRLVLTLPLLLGLCLTLAFSASAQGAGATALGWGSNQYGQTGNGAATETGCTCVPTPALVTGLSDATQISGGSGHALALRAAGTVAAWGESFYGQLGNGSTGESLTPVAVSGLTNVIEVDAGYSHSLALLANGTVMAWGENRFGQLGVGSGPETCNASPCSKWPVPVQGLSDVVAVAAGGSFSLALLANGTVMAWGLDNYGQLGDGVGIESGCQCVDHPVQVPGISGAMAISGGENWAMALLGTGAIAAWGQNSDGQLGKGTVTETPPPVCVCAGPGGVGGLSGPVSKIDAAGYHGVALLGNGTPQAWGYNLEGELGNGEPSTNDCYCIPTAVSVLGLSGVQSVAAGEYHTLALLGDGSVRSWGYNPDGPLGDGTETNRSAPVAAIGVGGASEVAAGTYTSFALIGPSHTLTVSLAGAGAGSVGGPDGIVCPAVDCVARFPDSQGEILRAEAAPGTGFAGFTGACTGTGTCQVRMDADQTVTATFGPPKGTQITKAKITQGKKPKKTAKASGNSKPTAKAKFSFTVPGAVTGYQCMLVKPKPKKSKGGKKKKKQKPPKFSGCSSPKSYKKLKKGSYTFKVRAANTLGVDAQPAVRKFSVKR